MEYDLIITGGGAAGLSMLAHLMSSEHQHQNILLLDQNPFSFPPKTWCFWDHKSPKFFSFQHRWKYIRLNAPHIQCTKKLDDLHYYEVRSDAFITEMKRQIQNHPNIQIRMAKVNALLPTEDAVFVTTDHATYKAKYVINSINGMFDTMPPRQPVFTQNFKGWRIQTEEAVFDPEKVILMDFCFSAKPVSFFYTLPYSRHEALIEFTRLSHDIAEASVYQQALDRYIKEQLKVRNYSITYEEFGVIEMEVRQYQKRPHKRIFQTGTAGGNTKPSTGFTFKNIQNDCALILQEISQGRALRGQNRKFMYYDRIMLKIMQHHPHAIPDLLVSLFYKNDAEKVFRFLDEKTSFSEDFTLFAGLRWSPFIKALCS
jgi:lycopene beta-cyclase